MKSKSLIQVLFILISFILNPTDLDAQLFKTENWIALRNIESITTYSVVIKDGQPTDDSTLFSIEYFNKSHIITKSTFFKPDSINIITQYGLKFDTICVQEQKFTSNYNKPYLKVLHEYDKKGNKTKTTSKKYKSVPLIYTYQYDKNDRVVKTKFYKDKKKISTTNTVYDDVKLTVNAITKIDHRDSTLYPYNINSRMITTYVDRHKMSSVLYDLKNNVIDSSWWEYTPTHFTHNTNFNTDHAYYQALSRPKYFENLKSERFTYYYQPNGLWLYNDSFKNDVLVGRKKYFYTYY